MRLSLSYICVIFLMACSHAGTKKYSGFGLDSLSTEDLKKYAPPTPRQDLKSKMEALVDLRAPVATAVTSDAKVLFVQWNVTGSNQIWKLKGPLSFPEQMTGGENHASIATISADDQWLVVQRDSKGDENFGLYLLSTKGGPLRTIYYNPKQQAHFNYFTPDSKFIYYNVNDKNPQSYSIYKYSVDQQSSELIWDQAGLWSLADLKNDTALLKKSTGSMQSEFYLLSLKDKNLKPLIGVNEKEDFDVFFAKEKDQYIVVTNKLSEFRRIYRWISGELKPISPEVKADVKGAQISEDKKYLVYLLNLNGHLVAQQLSLVTNKITSLNIDANALQTTLGQLSPHHRFLPMSTETHSQLRRNFVYDLEKHKFMEWTTASTPELSTAGYVKPVLETYTAEDGTKIPMFVWRPQNCIQKNCPVIVSFHGGPESQTLPRMSPLINLYTERGFIYVTPNVRGSDGYGKQWLRSDNGPLRLKVITDIRDCAIYIKKHWAQNGRPPKVGITGGSYGGYSTLVGMSMFAGTYDAGAAIVGMSNLNTFLQNTAPYRRQLRINEYGDPEKDLAALTQLSPSTYKEQVRQPLFIAHGATDPRVPVGEALQFYETIHSKNPQSKLVIFPDEGHGVSKRANVVLLNSYIIDFFETHLK